MTESVPSEIEYGALGVNVDPLGRIRAPCLRKRAPAIFPDAGVDVMGALTDPLVDC